MSTLLLTTSTTNSKTTNSEFSRNHLCLTNKICNFIIWFLENLEILDMIFANFLRQSWSWIFFYSLHLYNSETAKKSGSQSIQIDALLPKTPKVLRNINQEIRQAIQLNIIGDDENVTSEPSCAPTDNPFCSPHIWVFNDIETSIRARKCRNPCRVLKWIVHLIFKLIQLISFIGAWMMIVGLIVGAFFGIGYLFYLGTAVGVSAGIIGVILVLLFIGSAGGCNYFMETSS